MSEPLTSWVRTLNEDDALDLLEDARPGEPVEAWIARAHDLLPQSSRERRTGLIRLVRRHLLDVNDDNGTERVADTRYLQLIRQGNAKLRHDLLYARYLFENPWIDRALTELVHPTIVASERPLPPEDADLVPVDAWPDFVARHIKPGTGPESVKKTRTVLIKNLRSLGIISGQTRQHPTRAQRGEPARLAFGWLVAHELRQRGVTEMAEHLAATQTRAAHLFAPTPAYAEQCLVEAVEAGLLRRGHLVGQAQIYQGEL